MLANGRRGLAERWCFRDERRLWHWYGGLFPRLSSCTHDDHHVQFGPVCVLEMQQQPQGILLAEAQADIFDVAFSGHDECSAHEHSHLGFLPLDVLPL